MKVRHILAAVGNTAWSNSPRIADTDAVSSHLTAVANAWDLAMRELTGARSDLSLAETTIQERSKELAAATAKLAHRDEAINARDHSMRELDVFHNAELSLAENTIQRLNRELLAARSTLASAGHTMQRLNKALSASRSELSLTRDRAHQLGRELAVANAEIKRLNTAIGARDHTMKEFGAARSALMLAENTIQEQRKEQSDQCNRLYDIFARVMEMPRPCTFDDIVRAARDYTSLRACTGAVQQVSVTCIVCLDRNRECVLMPCAHYVLCADCASELRDCPICRAHIEQRVTVYGA
jgi:septal ring factor EnvC (AmiA/AmiB activator)